MPYSPTLHSEFVAMTTPVSPKTTISLPIPTITTNKLLPRAPGNFTDVTKAEKEQRRITLTDEPAPQLTAPLNAEKGKAKQDDTYLRAPVASSLKKTKSDSNMHRSFSFRRTKSTSKTPKAADGAIPPMPGHERGASFTMGERKSLDILGTKPAPGLQRSKSKRERFANAIANPDIMFKPDPQSPPVESKFNVDANSKWARTFFGNGRGIDFGSGVPQAPVTPPTPLPDLHEPIFNERLISPKIATELPYGHHIRPLCRSDYYRGYMELMRVAGRIGTVSQDMWAERCEWLRSMRSTYFIVVITAPTVDGTDEKVVATGTLLFEHKFLHSLGVVGHIEDIAVARDQKGKKMGLRVLEALAYIANERGCYKTMVNCTESNEAFHAQAGFSKEGTQMVLHHTRKKEEEVYS